MNGPRFFPPGWRSPVGVEGIQAPESFQNIPAFPLKLREGRFRPGNTSAPKVDVFDESDYVRLNGTIVVTLPLETSTVVLPESNQLRNFLGFRNASTAAIIYLNFGDTASVVNSWISLEAGQTMLLDTRIPQDTVYAYSSAADAPLCIVVSSTPGTSS